MRQSGKTKTVGNREITEMEYASSDGRNIPCVLSIPTGEGPFPCVVTIHGGQGNRDFQYLRTMAAPNRVSPHGFYWGRDIGGSRIGRGEKTPEEKAEEEKAREIIVAFFTKQFARTDVSVVSSPAVPAVAPTKPAASESGMNPPKAAPENPPGRLAQRGAGGAGMGRNPEETFKSLASGGDKVSKEQFKQHFAKQGGPLADRPEVVERIFDRLDADKDGELTLDEFKQLSALCAGSERTQSSGESTGTPEETPSTSSDAYPQSKADTRRTPTSSQADAIRKLRSRLADMPAPENLTRRTLTVGGKEREFFINIPAKCKGKPSPVVFALHGGATSTGLAMHLKADFTVLGEKEGYVTVYPSGVNGWNIGSHDVYSVKRRTSDADDIGFFRAMFDTLTKEGIADPKRIYVTGGSNGGVMTQFLVCHLADRIAGAGVVVATLPRAAEKDWPKPSRPVPILIMLGTVDPMKPWNGNADQMSADETTAFWRKQNACAGDGTKWDLPDRDPSDGCRAHAQRWEGKAPVLFYTLEGHGHGWPMQKSRDATDTGPKTRDISTPEEFWRFFRPPSRTEPEQE